MNAINSVRKLARFRLAEKITDKEYNSNLLMWMAYVLEEDLLGCIESTPTQLLTPYTDYLRSELLPVDFMPSPSFFLLEKNSQEWIDKAKQAYRPKYVRLYELMLEREKATTIRS